MTEHTPGPWHSNELSIWADYTQPNGNRHHCHVADITNRNDVNRRPSAEEYANARLIAAAPETAAERDRLKEINAELQEALADLYAINTGLCEVLQVARPVVFNAINPVDQSAKHQTRRRILDAIDFAIAKAKDSR